jgi:hypothetical protein
VNNLSNGDDVVSNKTTLEPAGRDWYIVSRWHEYEGEARANLLRIAGIGIFYLIELLDYHGLRLGTIEIPAIVSKPFHQVITGLALAWALTGMAVLICLKHQIFPAGLKYATTAADLVFLTLILLAASGPQSPLVIGYFLIIVLATLRFSLGLIRFAAAGAVAGYLIILGHGRWFRDPPLTVPRHHQLILVAGLALTGIILGQVIRRAARMAEEYSKRVVAAEEDKP